MNGVFSIIRVNENFLDFYAHEDGFARYQITYGLESICFTGAMWFYSITYYQTARDIKRLMQYNSPPVSDNPQERAPIVESDDKLLSSKRKTKRLIFNWLIFALLIIGEVLILVSVINQNVTGTF